MRLYGKISIVFFLATVLAVACVDPYHPDIREEDTSPVLVVEGRITDQEGPFTVRLSRSASIYGNPQTLYSDHPVSGANVHIFDNEGNDFILNEVYFNSGRYETDNKHLRGKPGNTYILNISTSGGMEYESSPQTLMDVPEIDSIYYEEDLHTYFEKEQAITEKWVNILVDSKPAINADLYLNWECEETWEFHMPTRILVDHGPPSPNGYNYEPPSWETVTIDQNNKSKCWITEKTRKILVSPVSIGKDRKVRRFTLQTIRPPSDKLSIRYSMLVKQYGIDAEAYNMLRKLRDANTSSSGIYAKIPGQVFGNITCCTTGDHALGYFFASGMKTKRIFINHSDLDSEYEGTVYGDCGWTTAPAMGVRVFLYGSYNNRRVFSDDMYCTDCRVRGTDTPPSFW